MSEIIGDLFKKLLIQLVTLLSERKKVSLSLHGIDNLFKLIPLQLEWTETFIIGMFVYLVALPMLSLLCFGLQLFSS